MKSHALLRTNVGLTTNAKLVVGGSYSLYLDAIISIPELSSTSYSKKQFSKDNYWDELVPYFFKGTPPNIAYAIKSDNDWDKMSTDFSKQYDELYNYGARNIIENKDYTEEYEYFAPLHISKMGLPSNFVIFRVDGIGLDRIGKDNFITEILSKLKCVKNFDLTRKTQLGEWLEKNFTSNKYFPDTPLYIDTRKLEFSYWNGIDYEDGGYSQKSLMLDSLFNVEQTFSDFQKFIFDNWQSSKVVYPNIINFSFLFDDSPATPTSLRKWSLNRYLGFYLDKLELVTKVSPYQTPTLRTDVEILDGNILSSPSSDSPFEQTWEKNEYPWIEVDGNFYKIQSYNQVDNVPNGQVRLSPTLLVEANTTKLTKKWKIISDIDLSGKGNLANKNIVKIETISSGNRITKINGDLFELQNWDSADVWLIEINESFHNLVKNDDGYLYINTDYGFEQAVNKFDYYINDPVGRKSISLIVDEDNPPVTFNIYKCYFTDIKDFDTDLIDTEFSKFEYIINDKFNRTDETKMFFPNLDSNANPKDLDDFELGGEIVNLPTSSEYVSNTELFQIKRGDLNELWRKNPILIKWGFQNSKSSYDYPYLLNNASVAEDFNRTTNVFDIIPNRTERNLDYFLTLNADSNDYSYHSLHVVDNSFDIDRYLEINGSGDYFNYFFSKRSEFGAGRIVKNTEKWSQFNLGSNYIPNETLFRGIKFKLWNVSSVQVAEGAISSVNIKGGNTFDDWKFAVLLSQNNYKVLETFGGSNIGVATSSSNSMMWYVIDNWKHDKTYDIRSVVNWNDILYISTTQSNIEDPITNPSNSLSWDLFGPPNNNQFRTIFWHPNFNGTQLEHTIVTYDTFGLTGPPLVYNDGEFYFSKLTVGDPNFWNPVVNYFEDDVVFFKKKTWRCTQTNFGVEPGSSKTWKTQNGSPSLFWYETNVRAMWRVVPFWQIDRDFSTPIWSYGNYRVNYVYWNDTVWGIDLNANPQPEVGTPPDQDPQWIRLWSMVPDTNFAYSQGASGLTRYVRFNGIIHQNNRFYLCVSNINGDTLENGITIYINKKRKNVLVNISVNDNTFTKSTPNEFFQGWTASKNTLFGTNRDALYNDLYSKLSANNFMNAINDLENKYQFSDFVKYVEISEDSSLKVWDFSNLASVSGLPYILKCDPPDEILVRNNSLKFLKVDLEKSELKPKRVLDGGKITSLDQLNWYNNLSFGSSIERSDDVTRVDNFSGLKNQLFNRLWRFSGNYSPIFKTVPLFKAPGLTMSWNGSKFDTSLTDFGMVRNRVVSKINPTKNLLRLRNNANLKSIYPMVNEFGYHFVDSFIFKSTWDFDYHVQTNDLPPPLPVNANLSIELNQNQSTNNEELL